MGSLIARMVMVYLEEMASTLLRSGMGRKEVQSVLIRELHKVPGVTKVNPDIMKDIVSNVMQHLAHAEVTMQFVFVFKHLY